MFCLLADVCISGCASFCSIGSARACTTLPSFLSCDQIRDLLSHARVSQPYEQRRPTWQGRDQKGDRRDPTGRHERTLAPGPPTDGEEGACGSLAQRVCRAFDAIRDHGGGLPPGELPGGIAQRDKRSWREEASAGGDHFAAWRLGLHEGPVLQPYVCQARQLQPSP